MNGKRLNEEQQAQVRAIIAPIAAEYTPNFPNDFCEVVPEGTGVFNLHCEGVAELGERIVAALVAAGYQAEYRFGSVAVRAPIDVPAPAVAS